MKELCKYKCEHCNTEYAEKNRAIECEENHKIKLKCKEKGGIYRTTKTIVDIHCTSTSNLRMVKQLDINVHKDCEVQE